MSKEPLMHEQLAILMEFYPKIFFIPKNGTTNKHYEALMEINKRLHRDDDTQWVLTVFHDHLKRILGKEE